MTTTALGRRAEQAVAAALTNQGFSILCHNWRKRYCEIDLVGRLGPTVYLIEVKYRSRNSGGKGLDYITAAKLRQMRLAARFWLAETGWSGPLQLSAVEVEGSGFTVGKLVLLE